MFWTAVACHAYTLCFLCRVALETCDCSFIVEYVLPFKHRNFILQYCFCIGFKTVGCNALKPGMLAVLFLQTLTGGGTRRACELGSQPPGLQHRLVGYRMRKCWRSSSLMVSAKHSQKYFLLASANTVMYTL